MSSQVTHAEFAASIEGLRLLLDQGFRSTHARLDRLNGKVDTTRERVAVLEHKCEDTETRLGDVSGERRAGAMIGAKWGGALVGAAMAIYEVAHRLWQ